MEATRLWACNKAWRNGNTCSSGSFVFPPKFPKSWHVPAWFYFRGLSSPHRGTGGGHGDRHLRRLCIHLLHLLQEHQNAPLQPEKPKAQQPEWQRGSQRLGVPVPHGQAVLAACLAAQVSGSPLSWRSNHSANRKWVAFPPMWFIIFISRSNQITRYFEVIAFFFFNLLLIFFFLRKVQFWQNNCI